MDEALRGQIAEWLREGLDAYGIDDHEAALSAWQRVLEVDPGNADAKDYIEAAGRPPARNEARAQAGAEAAPDTGSLLEDALELGAAGELADAWALLQGATAGAALDPSTSAVTDLLRARLVVHYRKRLGPDLVPRLVADAAAFEKVNLPPGAGFLASLCDGATRIGDLVALSGTDAFEALHHLDGLVDAGLVSVDA